MDTKNTMTAIGLSAHPILDEAGLVLKTYYKNELEALSIERLVVGVFFVGVKLSNGFGGVAYTPPGLIQRAGNTILKGKQSMIRGLPAAQAIAGDIPSPFAAVIRLAALNALSAPLLVDGRYPTGDGNDLTGFQPLFRNRRICIVGAIIPLLKRLKDLNPKQVIILDYKKETQAEAQAGYGTFVHPDKTAEMLADCDTAVFTGAAVANDTIGQLLDWTPSRAAVAVVGPSAGFIPEPLFQRNVALLGTAVVTDSDRMLDILAEGGGGYRLFGTCTRKINLLNKSWLKQLALWPWES